MADQTKVERKPKPLNGFWILVALTSSLAICWVPEQIFFTIALFKDVNWTGLFYKTSLLLFYLEAVVDPFLFGFSVSDIRTAIVDSILVQNMFLAILKFFRLEIVRNLT